MSVRPAMERLAADEALHAELAFRTLAWAVRTGGHEVAHAVAAAVAVAEAPAPGGSRTLPSHGLLGDETERALIASAMATVVLPCLGELLSG